jgi:hypothetical protein
MMVPLERGESMLYILHMEQSYTVRSLAAEVVHGAPYRFSDTA